MPLFSQHRNRRMTSAPLQLATPEPAGTVATTLLHRYRPLETRAAGGFGSVEICLDTRLQRRVAIKRMPLTAQAAGELHQNMGMALAEARTASLLQHPHIVSVIDFSYDAGYAYLVMEYVDGMTLEEFLQAVNGHSLTYDEAACIADALIQALSYAHSNGVLHLDIKPANVLIDRSGHVKLTDFGMASLASAAGFGGARGGTIGYMGPEQIEGLEVDERSDLFSLAAVLYESLCGAAPFRAATAPESLERIQAGVTPPHELLPDMPETVEYALMSCLSPHPESRIAESSSLGDYLATLGKAREGRKSLERMIARLTSDEPEDELEDGASEAASVSINPAQGALGTHWPGFQAQLSRGLSGVAAVYLMTFMLSHASMLQLGAPAIASISLALGIASFFAPQLGAAIVLMVHVLLISFQTPFLSVLLVASLTSALAIAWWLTWGRAHAQVATAFLLAAAASCVPGAPYLGAALVLPAISYWLMPSLTACALAPAFPFAACLMAAATHQGSLTNSDALAMIMEPRFLICAIGLLSTTAALSAVCRRASHSFDTSGSHGLFYLASCMPAILISVVAALANHMEITGSSTLDLPIGVGLACLSSILVWIYAYSFGFSSASWEGDLQ
ncbi:serine/threonine protein kinase [Collinsella sp. zg1085]|uniref:serine/threonine-protein kinase n=1 Tax=Collinsella sp. zg1085 TaxID=2844380 RepID=UPI001C0DCA86|nr:serine/threonine-protein kinase [Collinsella sp. zg1085]QWT17778.1 serine/threonine protein kinase [Collinsella sp. zg1085]